MTKIETLRQLTLAVLAYRYRLWNLDLGQIATVVAECAVLVGADVIEQNEVISVLAHSLIRV